MYLLFVIPVLVCVICVIDLNCVIFAGCPECRCFCGWPLFGIFCHVSIICGNFVIYLNCVINTDCPEYRCFCVTPIFCVCLSCIYILSFTWILVLLSSTNIWFIFVTYLYTVLLRRITRILSFFIFLMYLYIVYYHLHSSSHPFFFLSMLKSKLPNAIHFPRTSNLIVSALVLSPRWA